MELEPSLPLFDMNRSIQYTMIWNPGTTRIRRTEAQSRLDFVIVKRQQLWQWPWGEPDLRLKGNEWTPMPYYLICSILQTVGIL